MALREEESGIIYAIRSTLHEWRLVLQRVRKPDKDDYIHATKIIWMAILLVGSVAYVIHYTAYALMTP